MQRFATFTAVAAVLGAGVVAVMGVFAPEVAEGAEPVAASMDRNSAGILAGAFIGAAVALLSHTLVATALKLSTEAAFKALIVGFFAKCLGAILPWGAMTFLPQVERLADSTAYLVAFATVVVLVLGGGLFDHLKAVAEGSILNTPEKSPTDFESGSSDRPSGSAFSLPTKLNEGPTGASSSASASSVSSPVQPLGSSDTLESAT